MAATENPYIQTVLLTAAGVGVALLQGDQFASQVVVGSLSAAAGVVGNLVANRIQKDQDAKDALESFSEAQAIRVRMAEMVEFILLGEQKFDYDRETIRIAESTKQYWLATEIVKTKPIFPTEQFVAQLLDPTEPKILIGFWLNLLNESCHYGGIADVDQFRLHELAGALTRNIPKHVKEVFSHDILTGKDGFAELVLRMLMQIFNVSKETKASSEEQVILSKRLNVLMDSLADVTKTLKDEVNQNTRVLVSELETLQVGVNAKLDQVIDSQRNLTEMVSEVLSRLNVQSVPIYRDALELVADKYGLSTLQLQSVLSEYAKNLESDKSQTKLSIEAAIAAGDFSRAEEKAVSWSDDMAGTVEKAQQNFRSSSRIRSEALRYAGFAAFLAGEVQKALGYYQNALNLVSPDDCYIDWAECQEGIVGCHFKAGRLDLALTATLQVVQSAPKNIPLDAKRDFWNNHTLGVILHAAGNLAQAEPLLIRAFSVAKQHFAQTDSRVSGSLYALASFALDSANLLKAEELARSHVRLSQQINLLSSAVGVAGVYLLAKIFRTAGRFKEAETTQMQARDLALQHIPSSNPQYGMCLNELGLVYHNQWRLEEAEQSFKMAIDFEDKNNRTLSLDVSNYTANLGRLYIVMSRWIEAEQMLDRSYTVRKLTFGAEHPKSIELLPLLERIKAEKQKS